MGEDRENAARNPTKSSATARLRVAASWQWALLPSAALIGLAEYTGFRSSLTFGKGGFMAVAMLALIAIGWLIWPNGAGRARAGLPGESEQIRDTRWTRDGVLVFFYAGCWGVLLCAFQFLAHEAGSARVAFAVLGAAAVTACAAAVVGTLLGFIFAIPRAQRREPPEGAPTEPASGEGTSPATIRTSRAALGVNTNLEEISDWLTKIIVGMGLVNLEKIPAHLRGLGAYFGASFGDIPGRESLALALLLLFGTSGFLMGYLLTRLYLAGAFSRALSPGEMLERAVALTRGADAPPPDVIRKVEDAAAHATPAEVQEQVRKLALEYQFTRSAMLFTPERTARLDGIVLRMKGLAASAANMTDQLMSSSSEGERLAAVAFLHMRPDPSRIGWLGARFKEETPFIKYHAAHSLRRLLDVPLSPEQKAELRTVTENARASIEPSDTPAITPLKQILQRLDATK